MHMPSRKRSPHPGIVILKPQAASRRPALIRWRDPVTGKFRTEKLPELPKSQLRSWLRRRSYELEGQRLTAPARPRLERGLSTEQMFDLYFGEVRIADSTADAYRRARDRALSWPDLPKQASELTLASLRGLRAWLNRPDLTPASVNFYLRQLGAVLRHSRLAGRVPGLSAENIKDGLKTFSGEAEKKKPLTLDQIRQLVLALNGFIGEAGDQAAEAPALFRGLVLTILLSGMRLGEARALERADVQPDHIWLPKHKTKTRRARRVGFAESPSLVKVLEAMPAGGWGFTENQAYYQASLTSVGFHWTFQQLRVTCGSYLTCAPSIYGGASAYMSAARLGHSVTIAERHYVNAVSVPASAKTLEEAYGIADLL